MARQKRPDYTRRTLAEAAVGRWKQTIADRLRAQTDEHRATEDERRATEVDVDVYTLNCMLEFGHLNYVRTA